jgi:hypothetical protein
MQASQLVPSGSPLVRILAIGLIVYACAFAILLRNSSFEPAGAIVVLVVFGGVFPLLVRAATLRAVPLSISVMLVRLH